MEQYIPKSALLAEIVKRRKAIPRDETDERLKAVYGNEAFVLTDLLDFIDTLEVKEVDLDTDFGVCWGEYCDCGGNINDYKIAKHFFELGIASIK